MSEEIMYADLKFQDSSKTENGKSGIKAPAAPPRSWQCRVVALAVFCLLLLAGLGILGSMFYGTSNMQMGKLNKLQSFKEELQRNLSLQLIENMNSSVKIRNLSITLQKMATKLCHQLYKKYPEHKCKPCRKRWLWHEDSCYLLSQQREDWQTSEQECQNLNASLLKIKNKSVLDFIKSQTTDFWLGLSPRKNQGSFEMLKEKISSSDWFINNTNGFSGEMYCGYRYSEYVYYTLCTERKKFICEKLANRVKIENTLINEEPDGFT
ncbi:C-type lectin domain family 12 member A-like [Talpa occidentalis]|uniref:C-type lectin domain family 12 member A-like n=1 Tax=Talpa occidentalis TaxID=50954 RepID=UPI00188DF715|nr:C-type lectin domain family 12 member A-like [Talpa occidentalis]XP_037371214.1 C-type lectin domain family 12 member A-like [Talpa occidentalis]